MKYTYHIDVTPEGAPLVIYVSQYDQELREYLFVPHNGMKNLKKIENCSVTLEATKPDGKAILHSCIYNDDGTVTYILQEQLAAVVGNVRSKLTWRSYDGKILGAKAIIWVIDAAGINDDAVISDSDLSRFEEIIELASWCEGEMYDAVNRADDAADRAEQSAAVSGYMFFHIDNDGHLIYEHTVNVDVEFYLSNGHLIVGRSNA